MNIKKIAATSLVFLTGIGIGLGAYHIHVLDHDLGTAKARWLVCTHVHQWALYERAELYRKEFGHWPVSVKDLVEAHYLPEYSEVHLCPTQIDVHMVINYEGSSFVEKNYTGSVGYYASSPYRFQIDGEKFKVICTFDKKHNND